MSLYMENLIPAKPTKAANRFSRILVDRENGTRKRKRGVVSHYKTADFARTMFGSLPAENSERLMLAIKADADTVQYGATPPTCIESVRKGAYRLLVFAWFFV